MKKIFLLSLTFLLTTSSGTSFAMGNRFTQKMGEFSRKAAPYAKKAFGATCSGIGFGISAGPFLYEKAKTFPEVRKFLAPLLPSNKSKNEGVEVVSDKTITDFCQKELSRIDPNLNNTPIYLLKADRDTSMTEGAEVYKDMTIINQGSSNTYKHVLLITHGISELKVLVAQESSDFKLRCLFDKITFGYFIKPTNSTLNEWRYIIQHEGNHIINKDADRIGMATIAIPLANCFLLRHSPTTALGHLAKIPGGFAKFILNTALISVYRKHIEQQADNGVCDHISTLEAAQKWNMRNHKRIMTMYDKEYPDSTSPLLKEIRYILSIPDHPTPLARAQKFEERIAKLKAKEQATKQQQQG